MAARSLEGAGKDEQRLRVQHVVGRVAGNEGADQWQGQRLAVLAPLGLWLQVEAGEELHGWLPVFAEQKMPRVEVDH